MRAKHPVIRPATDAAALDAVRQLCWDYRALYAAMGFSERGPYQDVPDDVLPHLVFFETPL